jgi:hypothetical protein
MKHVLIVSLHRGRVMHFARHLDHEAHAVSYVTDPVGAETLLAHGNKIAGLIVVEDTASSESVLQAAGAIFRRHGPADIVFAPSEYDLLIAARVRDRFGIPGMTEFQTLLVRDKVHMKERLERAGIPTPRFSDCFSRDQVMRFAGEVGYPVVLKPRRGAGSKGIGIIRSEAALARAWETIDPQSYECEEFVSGPVLHVDGLVHRGRLLFSMVSRYVNTCLEAAQGLPLGSVVVDDRDARDRLSDFAGESIRALDLNNGAFHLEVILRGGADPVFLEVGARIGGGEIKPMVENVYGVDLLREWLNCELDMVEEIPVSFSPVGGWLVVPPPCSPPYEIVRAGSLLGRIPCLRWEALPHVGETHDRRYLQHDRWPGGRFQYAGSTSQEVELAIRETMDRYDLVVRPVREEMQCA